MSNAAAIKNEFAKALRLWRRQLGISQEELAERAGLHRTYISDVERGARNLSLESINKLARAMDISISALFPSSVSQLGQGSASQTNEPVDILLVEDSADDVELTLLAFRRSRISNVIHVVSDGVEALDYVFCRGIYTRRRHDQRPQLILLDLYLPKMNGIEVLRRLKDDQSTRSIPVVILTSSRQSKDVDECRRLGAETYIVKPVDFHSLSQVTPVLNLDWMLLKTTPSLQV